MRARSNFTAIAFGFMAGADMVKGDVITRDLQGKETGRFEVHADYALGGIAGGMDSTRMDWLHEKFAQLTLESLQSASDAGGGKSGAGTQHGNLNRRAHGTVAIGNVPPNVLSSIERYLPRLDFSKT
jgi:hypothetical protein